ncbi:MAG: hypothetical protein NTV34_15825 [Proteobacteria bacterium]|nr:hypothetical protein [Pseudomonadota bacterium]
MNGKKLIQFIVSASTVTLTTSLLGNTITCEKSSVQIIQYTVSDHEVSFAFGQDILKDGTVTLDAFASGLGLTDRSDFRDFIVSFPRSSCNIADESARIDCGLQRPELVKLTIKTRFGREIQNTIIGENFGHSAYVYIEGHGKVGASLYLGLETIFSHPYALLTTEAKEGNLHCHL